MKQFFTKSFIVLMVSINIFVALVAKTNTAYAFIGDYCSITVLGRNGCVGYFNGATANAAPVSDVMAGGMIMQNTVNDFIGKVVAGATDPAASNQNKTGASFIIYVMLGRNAPGNGIPVPQSDIDEWVDRVRYYEANGWINMNIAYFKADGVLNSAHFDQIGNPAFHTQEGAETVSVIQFFSPNSGNVVRIERSCANFVGSLSPLDDRPLNPSGTLTPTAGANGRINIGNSFSFATSIQKTNIANASGTYTVNVSGEGAGSGTVALTDGSGVSSNHPHTATYNSLGTFCRTITITAAPAGVTVGGPATQCVTVIQPIPVAFTFNSEASDYEKGSGDLSITHLINVTTMPCNIDYAPNEYIDSKNWTLSGQTTASGTIAFLNCADITQDSPSLVRVTQGPKITYIGNIDVVARVDVPGNNLKDNDPGYTVSSVITSGAQSSTGTSKVFEVPFARFFGNDVRVCGTGPENRFVYDTGTPKKGSYAQYASIYKNSNLPTTDFSGLNNHRSLLSNFDGVSCLNTPNTTTDFKNPATTIPSGSVSTSRTIKKTGPLSINNNIIVDDPHTAAPDDYPAVLIYVEGDINISSSVTQIDAVLIATGTINTCSDANSNNNAAISDVCRKPLKINGALIADTVNLQRSGGTRFLTNDSEDGPTSVGVTGNNTSASEIVEYPWQLNFVNFDLVDVSQTKLNAYYAVPPRL